MSFRPLRQGLPAALAAAGATACLAGAAWAFDQQHAAWDRIVKDHVHGGLVDYAKLKREPKALESYLDSLDAAREPDYAAWDRNEKIAFWINAYNALTLKAVLDHYPVKASWSGSLRYPKNSIRQIPGVWDRLKFKVMGRDLTLDEIEHGILRKEFREPRVHMALVCASLGCPPLRREAYTGPALESQLDDQARRFLETPSKFKMDKAAGTLYLSPIFRWFSQDFKPDALAFIGRYLDDSDRAYLTAGKFKIVYLDYDWSLNERAAL